MTTVKMNMRTARGNAQAMERVFLDMHVHGMGVQVMHADGTIQRIDPRVFVEMMKQMQRDPDVADRE